MDVRKTAERQATIKRAVRQRKPVRGSARARTGQSRKLARILRILRGRMPELAAQYGINSLGVFGSYARQDYTRESDLDLLVEFGERHLTLLGYIHIENELSDVLGIKVEMVEKEMLKSPILEHVMEEVVLV